MNRDETFQTWLQNHVFTPSELEDYQLCPYRFYARSFLRLEGEKEWEVELSPSDIGRLVHRILETFLQTNRNERDKTRLEEKALCLLENELTLFQKDHPHLSKVLLERQKKRMARTLLSFIEQDLLEGEVSKTLKPTYFEWDFGRKTAPLEIPNNAGPPIKIAGRIDRIDIDEAHEQFLVIDYKTGSTKIRGSQITSGEALQLPLYILAVQRLLLPGFEPIGGLYYHLSDMSKKDGLLHTERLPESFKIHPSSSSLIPPAKWNSTFQAIEEMVRTIVGKIRREEFPSEPEPCEPYCPYRDVCRIRAARQVF